MIQRKPLAWFLGLAFAISWPLFLLPLLLQDLEPVTAQMTTQGLWALGGTLAAPTGWLGMAIFVGWLALTKRLPVRVGEKVEI